jgi:hypothetical protein
MGGIGCATPDWGRHGMPCTSLCSCFNTLAVHLSSVNCMFCHPENIAAHVADTLKLKHHISHSMVRLATPISHSLVRLATPLS